MCGRYTLTTPADVLADYFDLSEVPELQGRFNIAPTQEAPVVRAEREGGERILVPMKWGLVPYWADDPAIGNRMINARAETVAEKPSFRAAYRHRRCIVLADGFYEWQRDGNVKTPYFISLATGGPFAFAALWENWTDKETGESLQTTTLITTEANDFMKPLHHRMPVVLEANGAGEWLAGSNELLDDIDAMTPPLQAWPVDRRVNNARNEGEDLVDAVGGKIGG